MREGWGAGKVVSQDVTSVVNPFPPPNPLPEGGEVYGYEQSQNTLYLIIMRPEEGVVTIQIASQTGILQSPSLDFAPSGLA